MLSELHTRLGQPVDIGGPAMTEPRYSGSVRWVEAFPLPPHSPHLQRDLRALNDQTPLEHRTENRGAIPFRTGCLLSPAHPGLATGTHARGRRWPAVQAQLTHWPPGPSPQARLPQDKPSWRPSSQNALAHHTRNSLQASWARANARVSVSPPRNPVPRCLPGWVLSCLRWNECSRPLHSPLVLCGEPISRPPCPTRGPSHMVGIMLYAPPTVAPSL